ncbi:MAG: hypothetical protein R2755_14940 [Acidimicrobiales bacterium]
MSVPVGTLTDAFRTDLLNFWGEHRGVLLPTPEAVEIAWTAIVADRRVTDREEIVRGPGGYRQFSVRYLLPMRVEVQHLPAGFGAA